MIDHAFIAWIERRVTRHEPLSFFAITDHRLSSEADAPISL